jgi:hypothetical protein
LKNVDSESHKAKAADVMQNTYIQAAEVKILLSVFNLKKLQIA